MRDVLIDHRFKVVSEDTWGSEIVSAAVAHFAASTPPAFLVNATDLHLYNTRSLAHPGPRTDQGRIFAPDTPGLGVTPDFEALGSLCWLSAPDNTRVMAVRLDLMLWCMARLLKRSD